MAKIRILAADDHPVFRQEIAGIIANEADMEPVAEASNGREALEQYKRLTPDVTLLDLQMPEMSGLDAIEAIRALRPSARIIVLTTYVGDALAQKALRAGAQAYLLKGLLRKELLDTIRAVHSGHKRINSEVASQMAQHTAEECLSAREIEVLKLIACGNSNKRIEVRPAVTGETIKGHVENILAKLGASDRTHAVTLALT